MNHQNTKSTPDVSSKASPKKIIGIYTQNDESFYRQLQIYLSLWQWEKYIQWLEIPAGSDVERMTQSYIQQADLILLFISPDFFAEHHCYTAMKTSLQEQAKRQVPVVPILVRASTWKESACGSLYALPGSQRPVAQWEHPEQAYGDIRLGLVYLIPGDQSFHQNLMQETTRPGADSASTQKSEEAQKPASTTQSGGVNIANVASNNGQIGNFYAPINNYHHGKEKTP